MGFLWTTSRPLAVEVNQARQEARVIIQGDSVATISAAVHAVEGEVTRELGMIKGIGARLTPTQIRQLESRHGTLRIRPDRTTPASGSENDDAC